MVNTRIIKTLGRALVIVSLQPDIPGPRHTVTRAFDGAGARPGMMRRRIDCGLDYATTPLGAAAAD
jgi:hypothetical protein